VVFTNTQTFAAFRPFQENKSPKNGQFSEEKASGLGGFNFWNYLRATERGYPAKSKRPINPSDTNDF
jgi:hypothetical protein